MCKGSTACCLRRTSADGISSTDRRIPGCRGRSQHPQLCRSWGGGDLLVAAQPATQPVSDDTHGADVQQVSSNAYSLLAQKTKGDAQTLVILIGEVLLDWEGLIARCSDSSGAKVRDSIQCATVWGWAPRHVEAMLRSSSAASRHRYADMETAIREFYV